MSTGFPKYRSVWCPFYCTLACRIQHCDVQRLGSLDDTTFVAKLSRLRSKVLDGKFFAYMNSTTWKISWLVNGESRYRSPNLPRISTCGEIHKTVLTLDKVLNFWYIDHSDSMKYGRLENRFPDKALNSFVYASPLCVIIYRITNFEKFPGFLWPTRLLVFSVTSADKPCTLASHQRLYASFYAKHWLYSSRVSTQRTPLSLRNIHFFLLYRLLSSFSSSLSFFSLAAATCLEKYSLVTLCWCQNVLLFTYCINCRLL